MTAAAPEGAAAVFYLLRRRWRPCSHGRGYRPRLCTGGLYLPTRGIAAASLSGVRAPCPGWTSADSKFSV